MLSYLLYAFAKDALVVVHDEEFFAGALARRQERVLRVLSPQYPRALQDYLLRVSKQDFVEDMRFFLEKMSGDRLIEQRTNGFLQAVYEALVTEVAEVLDSGASWEGAPQSSAAAGVLIAHLKEGRAVELARDIQRFLHTERGASSPTVQSALPLSSTERSRMRESLTALYQGSFPAFEVETSLLGGLRLFFAGEMRDQSWAAELARVFSRWRQSVS